MARPEHAARRPWPRSVTGLGCGPVDAARRAKSCSAAAWPGHDGAHVDRDTVPSATDREALHPHVAHIVAASPWTHGVGGDVEVRPWSTATKCRPRRSTVTTSASFPVLDDPDAVRKAGGPGPGAAVAMSRMSHQVAGVGSSVLTFWRARRTSSPRHVEVVVLLLAVGPRAPHARATGSNQYAHGARRQLHVEHGRCVIAVPV